MKRVLLIAYYFPPLGGVGVTRPTALWNLLPGSGYECHVLTVKPVAYHAWEPGLLDGKDTSTIYRSDSWDPQRLMYLLGVRTPSRKARVLGKTATPWLYPDNKRGWIRPAISLGRTLLANRRYDAIMSTSPPMSCHVIAHTLTREFQIPWLADFRDKWSVRGIEDVFAGNDRNITRGRKFLSHISSHASAITCVNASVRDYVGRGEIIENSYSPDEVKLFESRVASSTYTIGLFGTFNDMFPVEPLLQVMSQLPDREKERVRIVQVGSVENEWLSSQLSAYKLTAQCECHGFVERHTAMSVIKSCSMFFMSAGEQDSGLTTGRIFTLLASGRPILACVPKRSEIASLVAQSGNGLVFGSESLSEAVEFLRERVARFERVPEVFECPPKFAERYVVNEMVRRFASVLNTIT